MKCKFIPQYQPICKEKLKLIFLWDNRLINILLYALFLYVIVSLLFCENMHVKKICKGFSEMSIKFNKGYVLFTFNLIVVWISFT